MNIPQPEMEQNGGANDDVAACSSKNFWDEPNPQFRLVGNYLPEEIRGEEFPKSPSVTFQLKCVGKALIISVVRIHCYHSLYSVAFVSVKENACFATEGRRRILFVRITTLKKLSEDVSQIRKRHEIMCCSRSTVDTNRHHVI